MQKLTWIAAGLAGMALASTAARASLDFPLSEADLIVESGAAEVATSFRFSNTGEADTTVTTIHSSCGCTVAELDDRVYAPGESGEIKVTFTIGGRTGTQIKQIAVHTDDPDQPVVTLTLRVEIPEPLTAEPERLLWSAGDPPGPKEIILTTAPGLAFADLRASVRDRRLQLGLQPLPEPAPPADAEGALGALARDSG